MLITPTFVAKIVHIFLLFSTEVLFSVQSKPLHASIGHTSSTVSLWDMTIRPVTSSSPCPHPVFLEVLQFVTIKVKSLNSTLFLTSPSVSTSPSPTWCFLLQREMIYFSFCIHVPDLNSLCAYERNCQIYISWVTTTHSPPLSVFNLFRHWPDKALINHSMYSQVLMRTRCLTETG